MYEIPIRQFMQAAGAIEYSPAHEFSTPRPVAAQVAEIPGTGERQSPRAEGSGRLSGSLAQICRFDGRSHLLFFVHKESILPFLRNRFNGSISLTNFSSEGFLDFRALSIAKENFIG
jgi:hypothetical protein